MYRNPFFKVVAILVPGLALVVGIPLAAAPFAGDARGFFGPYFWTALPVYLGVLAAPGYIACITTSARARASGPARRWWIRASLLVAALVSLAALWGATLMFLFAPPAIIVLVFVILLWVRFERATTTTAQAAHHAGG